MVKSRFARAKWWIALLLVVLAAVSVLIVLAQTYDPVRTIYKRLKESDPYVFEEIRPEFADIDFGAMVQVRNSAELESIRSKLMYLVYGEPFGKRDPVRLYPTGHDWAEDADLLEWDHVKSVKRYFSNPGLGVLMFATELQPAKEEWNARTVLYQHGMAGTFHRSRHLLERLLSAGYRVMVFDQLGYGANSRNGPCLPNVEECRGNLQFDFHQLDRPLRTHIEPLRAAIDLAFLKGSKSVDAIGFSAGAGTVTLAGAIDPRLDRTVAIAGVFPDVLREGQEQPFGLAWEIIQEPEVSFLDLFVAASSGDGRRYVQIFNRYDRCCFRNTKGLLYRDAVSDAVDQIGENGGIHVLIDESHADHKISDWAAWQVLDLLAEGR